MRAAVLFFLFPAGAFVAVTFYVWIRPQWGILEPKGVLDVITCDHSSGIFMIWNRELNLARFLAFVVWMGGFLVFFLFRLVREQLIMKKIRAASAEWKDERVLAISAVFRRGLGIRRDIGIYKCGFIASPFSAGILHTDIFFPSDTRCGEEFCFTLKHELVHCKRKDVIYHLLMTVVRGIHWYNPVIGLFERDFFQCCEIACDEKVLEHADSKERYRYAKFLLEMMTKETKDQTSKIRIRFTGRNEKEAQRRMLHIIKEKKKAAKYSVIFMAVCFVVLCPVVTFAASQVVYSADSCIAKKAEDAVTVVEEMRIPVFTEYTGYQELTEEDILDFERLRLVGRTSTNIDVSVSGSSDINLLTVSLNKGDSVNIALLSDSGQDSFVAGIKDKSGRQTFIYSKEGSVMHSFSIDEKSEYIVFVRKIKAADGKRIKIKGSVSVRR